MYYLIGQIFYALFASIGIVVSGYTLYDWFFAENNDDPFDDHELDFIPKSMQKYF